VVPECFQRLPVGRDGVIGEEAPDDLLKPSPLLGDWLVHAPSQYQSDALPASLIKYFTASHLIANELSLDARAFGCVNLKPTGKIGSN
jgi:hypothetical protein